jgi:hypothetical protein
VAVPYPASSHRENGEVARPKQKKKAGIRVSVVGVSFVLLAILAALQGWYIHDNAESAIHQIYGAAWFNIAAILLVGAALISQVKQLEKLGDD